MGRDPGATPSVPSQTAGPTARPDPTAEPTQTLASEQPGPTQSVTPTPAPTPSSNRRYIGMDAAKGAALAHAGVAADQARFTRVGMDYEGDTAVYVLEFYTSTRQYRYKINARTGVVLSREVEKRSD